MITNWFNWRKIRDKKYNNGLGVGQCGGSEITYLILIRNISLNPSISCFVTSMKCSKISIWHWKLKKIWLMTRVHLKLCCFEEIRAVSAKFRSVFTSGISRKSLLWPMSPPWFWLKSFHSCWDLCIPSLLH